MKKIGKRSIWISIVVATMLLTGCGNQTGSADRATGSDAVASVPSTTEVVGITTEVAPEVVVNEGSKPQAVPATTEIGGGKKKAEETTEEKKPNSTESTKPSTNHSNSGSASSGQSTTPKPSNSGSNSGNSGNSGSNNGGSNNSGGNSGNSSSNNGGATAPATTEAPRPSTTEAPTTQHQHVYDQVKVDTPAWTETIVHPAEYKTVPAMQCHGCKGIFTSADAYFSHPCGDAYGFTETNAKEKVKEETTEYVEHPEVTHRECKCGARE